MKHDNINHPKHYMSHPSGVECITITEHMSFCLGNAIKYIWRAGQKSDSNGNRNSVEDLKKAVWYLQREISKLEATQLGDCQTYTGGTHPLIGAKIIELQTEN